MEIRNGKDAFEFIRAWQEDTATDGRRTSVARIRNQVRIALDGMATCLAIAERRHPEEADGYRDAIGVFEQYLAATKGCD